MTTTTRSAPFCPVPPMPFETQVVEVTCREPRFRILCRLGDSACQSSMAKTAQSDTSRRKRSDKVGQHLGILIDSSSILRTSLLRVALGRDLCPFSRRSGARHRRRSGSSSRDMPFFHDFQSLNAVFLFMPNEKIILDAAFTAAGRRGCRSHRHQGWPWWSSGRAYRRRYRAQSVVGGYV